MYAKKMLISKPHITITEIAKQSGYVSQSNFTRIFTSTEGMAPGQWRRENGNE